MKPKLIAEILAIIYTLFISMFAFDIPIFSLGFLIHLIPSLILLTSSILAWFKPRTGAIIFAILGITTIIFFKTYEIIWSLITITLIPILIGILFWFNKK